MFFSTGAAEQQEIWNWDKQTDRQSNRQPERQKHRHSAQMLKPYTIIVLCMFLDKTYDVHVVCLKTMCQTLGLKL